MRELRFSRGCLGSAGNQYRQRRKRDNHRRRVRSQTDGTMRVVHLSERVRMNGLCGRKQTEYQYHQQHCPLSEARLVELNDRHHGEQSYRKQTYWAIEMQSRAFKIHQKREVALA